MSKLRFFRIIFWSDQAIMVANVNMTAVDMTRLTAPSSSAGAATGVSSSYGGNSSIGQVYSVYIPYESEIINLRLSSEQSSQVYISPYTESIQSAHSRWSSVQTVSSNEQSLPSIALPKVAK